MVNVDPVISIVNQKLLSVLSFSFSVQGYPISVSFLWCEILQTDYLIKKGHSSVVDCMLCMYESWIEAIASTELLRKKDLKKSTINNIGFCCVDIGSINTYFNRCIAGLAASRVSHVLFKLLQTVQHGLLQQISSSGCSDDAAFTWNRPQLLNAGMQPGQVTTDLL